MPARLLCTSTVPTLRLPIQRAILNRLRQMRQGLAAVRSTGAELWSTCHLAWLAEAHGKSGQPEGGLHAIA